MSTHIVRLAVVPYNLVFMDTTTMEISSFIGKCYLHIKMRATYKTLVSKLYKNNWVSQGGHISQSRKLEEQPLAQT